MRRGVMTGVSAGSVLAVLGLGMLSVALPLRPQPQSTPPALAPLPTSAPVTPAPGLPLPSGSPDTAVSLPPGSEFSRAAQDQAPAAPEPASAPQAPMALPEAPVALPEVAPALNGTEPSARPVLATEAPRVPTAPETARAALDAEPAAEVPMGVPPPGEAVAPALPVAEAALEPAPEVAPAVQPAAEASAAPKPQTEAEPPPPPAPEEITLMPDGAVVPPGPELPRVFAAGEGSTRFASVDGTRVNRLPQIGAEPQAQSLPAASTPAQTSPRLPQILPEVAVDPAEAPAPELSALQAFAAPFTATPGLPPYAIVLIDEGAAKGGLDRETIKALGLAVTVALAPSRPDVAEAAADYRAAGFEVAILAEPLPAGASAQDFEVAFADWHRRLPEAVALVEPEQPILQGDSKLVLQAVRVLEAEGMAYVTQALGMVSAAQIAQGAGLPEASIWRVLDARRDKAPMIARTLSRAAFEASRQQGVVVMLSSWPESVAGLQDWAPDAKGRVDIAPVSALLQSRMPAH